MKNMNKRIGYIHSISPSVSSSVHKWPRRNKVDFYLIDPMLNIKTGTPLFGYFDFMPCPCGCTDFYGWGFNLGLFGFNVRIKQ